jgi:hypothetical protein
MPTRADAPLIRQAFMDAAANGRLRFLFAEPIAIQRRANAFEARTGFFEEAPSFTFTDARGTTKDVWAVTGGAPAPIFFYANNGKLVASGQRDPHDPNNILLDVTPHEPRATHWQH